MSNSLAVVHGLLSRGGVFVRTPKSGSVEGQRAVSPYQLIQDRLWIVELLAGAYCLFSFAVYFNSQHRLFSVFLFIYAVSLLLTGWLSRRRRLGPDAASTFFPTEHGNQQSLATPHAVAD